MNEQIPEWLKQEAAKYAQKEYPVKTEEEYYKNDVDEPYYDYSSVARIIQYRIMEAYIAGTLSRSGGVWVKELTDFINVMKTNQTLINGCDIETIHIPSLLHKVKELSSESPAADKGDAIEFAEWIRSKEYEPLGGGWIEQYFGQQENKYFTTEQLYQLFHQSK